MIPFSSVLYITPVLVFGIVNLSSLTPVLSYVIVP